MLWREKQQNSTAIIAWIIVAVLFVSDVTVADYANAQETMKMPANTLHKVDISGFEFVPEELKVSSGDIVVWTNHDIVPHRVDTNGIKKIMSPEIAAGGTFRLVVKGSMTYKCGLHPSMKGKLISK